MFGTEVYILSRRWSRCSEHLEIPRLLSPFRVVAPYELGRFASSTVYRVQVSMKIGNTLFLFEYRHHGPRIAPQKLCFYIKMVVSVVFSAVKARIKRLEGVGNVDCVVNIGTIEVH